MWLFARGVLGLSRREFLLLQPWEYRGLVKGHRQREERREHLLALVGAQTTAMVANTGFRSFEKPREPKEFMPSHWSAAAQPRRKRSDKDFTAELERVMDRAVKYQEAQHRRGID